MFAFSKIGQLLVFSLIPVAVLKSFMPKSVLYIIIIILITALVYLLYIENSPPPDGDIERVVDEIPNSTDVEKVGEEGDNGVFDPDFVEDGEDGSLKENENTTHSSSIEVSGVVLEMIREDDGRVSVLVNDGTEILRFDLPEGLSDDWYDGLTLGQNITVSGYLSEVGEFVVQSVR